MELGYDFLQHYWGVTVSLLGGILVFLLFVQGGQGLLYGLGRNARQRDLIIASLHTKWALTFTTLVMFGGAVFASFPLYYSTSFGGAFYLWMSILLLFVVQAVAFEFRGMSGNVFGDRFYEWILAAGGIGGTFLLGVAVGMYFTGGNFDIDMARMSASGGDVAISRWTSPWRGLEMVFNPTNSVLGIMLVLLSRVLALEYFINDINDSEMGEHARKMLRWHGVLFVVFFVVFMIRVLTSVGVSTEGGVIHIEQYKFLHNMVQMPVVALLFMTGAASVVTGILLDLLTHYRNGIWFGGAGTIAVVTALLIVVGFNNTAYFRSLVDIGDSITMENSSSSRFTLQVMFYVSLLIPVVVAYVWYVWRAMNRGKTSERTVREEGY